MDICELSWLGVFHRILRVTDDNPVDVFAFLLRLGNPYQSPLANGCWWRLEVLGLEVRISVDIRVDRESMIRMEEDGRGSIAGVTTVTATC